MSCEKNLSSEENLSGEKRLSSKTKMSSEKKVACDKSYLVRKGYLVCSVKRTKLSRDRSQRQYFCHKILAHVGTFHLVSLNVESLLRNSVILQV